MCISRAHCQVFILKRSRVGDAIEKLAGIERYAWDYLV